MADPYRYFRVEAAEILEQLQKGLLELERGAPATDTIPMLLRLAHTLKGAARVVKQKGIADLSICSCPSATAAARLAPESSRARWSTSTRCVRS